jgi:hypothetical protein
MLEQPDLTDDERQALEGDREAITALAAKLADVPTPAGPTPNQLGHAPTRSRLAQPGALPQREVRRDLDRRPSSPSMATSAKSYGVADSRAAVSRASNCR